jgi:4-amino-4-deoxy-L-arabinose transferase-like glycosyltransferase
MTATSTGTAAGTTVGPETRGRDRQLIAAALALALVVRVVIVVLTRHTYHPVADAADFSRIATSIAHGHGFGSDTIATHGPSAFRTPLWPAVLGAVYAVVGTKITAGRLVLAVISTGFIGMVGAVAWKVVGRTVGLICLFAGAVYPPFLLASYGLNYEVLMGVLVFSALYFGLRWRDHPGSWSYLVLAGVCSGLAVLCRENAAFVLVPLWVFIYQARARGERGLLIRRLLIVTGCAVIVVAPWTIRNAEQLHAFVPVSDSPGYTLAGDYNAFSMRHLGTPQMWVPPQVDPTNRALMVKDLHDNEAQLSAALQSQAIHFILHHPSSVPKVVGWNIIRLLSLQGVKSSNWTAGYIGWPVHFVELSVVSFWGIALLAIPGAFTRKARRIPWAIWLFPVLWCISLVLTSTILQYRLVVEPFVLILAAITVLRAYEKQRGVEVDEPTDAGMYFSA